MAVQKSLPPSDLWSLLNCVSLLARLYFNFAKSFDLAALIPSPNMMRQKALYLIIYSHFRAAIIVPPFLAGFPSVLADPLFPIVPYDAAHVHNSLIFHDLVEVFTFLKR